MPSASELPHSWLEVMAVGRGCRWSRGNVARSCPGCLIPAALGHEGRWHHALMTLPSCVLSEALPVAGRDQTHLSQEDLGALTQKEHFVGNSCLQAAAAISTRCSKPVSSHPTHIQCWALWARCPPSPAASAQHSACCRFLEGAGLPGGQRPPVPCN